MEEKELDKVAAFDTLFTTNRIQMYKVLLSYLPPSFQRNLAVYIKLSELHYTLSFFNRHPRASLCSPALGAFSPNGQRSSFPIMGQGFSFTDNERFSRLFDDISPYLSQREQNRLAQMKNMMQSMKNMQEMMEMMEMMKSLFPEGMGTSDNMNFDPSMLTQIMQMMNFVPEPAADFSADSAAGSATNPSFADISVPDASYDSAAAPFASADMHANDIPKFTSEEKTLPEI
ncbi:MAG: hypothetical protein NC094_00830 [Bacteroidales bacterium]|nr:hypothetical protein [Lachnoclostridium sp.]MCM1383008.1 hypothetical protein [Lachnoclostridium sp.]MCM1463938.1 hypothetical protein [Bacteroidales bacterium]